MSLAHVTKSHGNGMRCRIGRSAVARATTAQLQQFEIPLGSDFAKISPPARKAWHAEAEDRRQLVVELHSQMPYSQTNVS